MKKFISIIISSSYVLALMCVGIMGYMGNMNHSMAMSMNHSPSTHTPQHRSVSEFQDVSPSMECLNCALSEALLSGAATFLYDLFDISVVIPTSFLILFLTVSLGSSYLNLSKRGPPFSFVDPFLAHLRTVVLRD